MDKKDSAARHRILYTRLQKIPASVFVNDLDITKVFAGEDIPNLLNTIPIENIERIGYVKDRLQATTLDIYIYLKPGCSFYPGSCRLDFIQCTPLGYHTPVEFYHPKYEIAEERDNPERDERSTLYWNPAVRLIPGDREKELYFYTSDTGGPYRIVIEGMTNRGEAVRKVKIIR